MGKGIKKYLTIALALTLIVTSPVTTYAKTNKKTTTTKKTESTVKKTTTKKVTKKKVVVKKTAKVKEVAKENIQDTYTYITEISELKDYKLNKKNTSIKEVLGYEWYFDQNVSGPSSLNNCGPASAAMALKWLDPLSNKLPSDLREDFGTPNVAISNLDVGKLLADNGALVRTVKYTKIEDIINVLDKGYLILSLLNTEPLTGTNAKHWVTIYDYEVIENNTLLILNDPNSANKGGQCVTYTADVIDAAINQLWKYLLVVAPIKE